MMFKLVLYIFAETIDTGLVGGYQQIDFLGLFFQVVMSFFFCSSFLTAVILEQSVARGCIDFRCQDVGPFEVGEAHISIFKGSG